MTMWFAHLIPLLTIAARDGEEYVTELRELPEGWLGVAALAVLLAICGTVWWMYRREGRGGASTRVRLVMATIRIMVLVLLAIIVLEPVRVRILRKWIDSYTVVLLDDSSSMDLADNYRDEPTKQRLQALLGRETDAAVRRSDLVEPILGGPERSVLRTLADNNRLKVYTFNEEPKLQATVRAGWERPSAGDGGAADGAPGSSGDGNAPATSSPSATTSSLVNYSAVPTRFAAVGPATNIERAVRRSIESLGSAPIAGVVVLSDGGFNQGASAEQVARFAKERRAAIYSVGIGDPSSPRNVRVAEVQAPDSAFKNDPFVISARIHGEGLDGEHIRVELVESEAVSGAEGRVVDSVDRSIGVGGAVEPVSFQRRQERVGRFAYTVRVPVLDDESVGDDNARSATVNVIDTRTRVLVVAGGPSWEYQFVSRLLQRDQSVDVSCWLQTADERAVRDGDIVIDHLPFLAEELFAFDVIILLDADPADLSEEWCGLIDTFVADHGGGLLVSVGRPHVSSLMREPSLDALRDLLPVSPDPEADLILNQIGHYQLTGSAIEIPSEALGHPMLRAGDDAAATRLVWQGLGDIHWHYPVLREKPAATVLIRHGNPRMRNSYGGHVLAAVQFVGAGRVGFLAFDGTWRWRKQDVALFDRFWVQSVRFLSEGKLLGGGKRGTLMTDADQYSLGQSVTVTARLFDARFEPLQQPEVRAVYSVDDERREMVLPARADHVGTFEGRFVPDRAGSYRVSVRMPGVSADEPVEIVRDIRVSRPNLEIIRPQMSRNDLVVLAEGSHGGRYYEIDEAQELAEAIQDLHAEIPVRSRPTSLWDNAVALWVLVGLVCVEWGMRKWYRLL